jgi:hypothetical protein
MKKTFVLHPCTGNASLTFLAENMSMRAFVMRYGLLPIVALLWPCGTRNVRDHDGDNLPDSERGSADAQRRNAASGRL